MASSFVTLVAQGGFSFHVPEQAALASGHLRRALEGGFIEGSEKRIELLDYPPRIIDLVAEYLMYKNRYEGKDAIPDFTERIPAEYALELLMAADYLDM